jgi:hypothetical protein
MIKDEKVSFAFRAYQRKLNQTLIIYVVTEVG